MSMIGNYLLVEEEIIQKIKSGEIEISEFLYGREHSKEEFLDVDKSWHAIHYMLCDSAWEGELPYFNTVLGGTIINDEDIGYGPARYLTPSEIEEVFYVIKDITELEFRKKYDWKEMAKNDIYPQFSNDEFEYVWSYFILIQKMFEKASSMGRFMLLYLN